eukprot:scaffold124583_cov30-Tisochrysis_lutea.AAC.6
MQTAEEEAAAAAAPVFRTYRPLKVGVAVQIRWEGQLNSMLPTPFRARGVRRRQSRALIEPLVARPPPSPLLRWLASSGIGLVTTHPWHHIEP